MTRSFKKQIQKIKDKGTEEEKKNAIRLENQATHGTTLSRGTGLIDNFWMRRGNFTNHENMKVFLSCDGVQMVIIFRDMRIVNKKRIVSHWMDWMTRSTISLKILKNNRQIRLRNGLNRKLTTSGMTIPILKNLNLNRKIRVYTSDTDGLKPAPAPLLLPSKLKYFVESYTRMNESKKWLLSSGTCVENVLFHGGKALSSESLIHSWTIDLSDWETKELFSEEDWCKIKRWSLNSL